MVEGCFVTSPFCWRVGRNITISRGAKGEKGKGRRLSHFFDQRSLLREEGGWGSCRFAR